MKDEDLRKQAWDFFQMQAGQRLTTFNFYITISSLLSTGLVASLKPDLCGFSLGILFSILLLLFSFVFWKLDHRNRVLIYGAEQALIYFETNSILMDENSKPHIAKRFTREAYDTSKSAINNSLYFWNNSYSYTTCFGVVFIGFGLFGLVGFVISVINCLC